MTNQSNSGNGARDEALRRIEDDDFDGAIAALENATAADASGETHALLGLAHYRREAYSEAARYYEAALTIKPDHADWRHMARLAADNATAEVNVMVPPEHIFTKDELLAPPAPGTLPEPLPRTRKSLRKRATIAVGRVFGFAAGKAMNGLIKAVGGLRGWKDDVWTNWYRRKYFSGLLTLGYMREHLNAHNLKSTYPAGARIGFQPENLKPPPGVANYRTADGSWNNLADPMEGAAGTRFPRNVENAAIKPAGDADLLDPNPRLISLELFTRGDEMLEVPFLNMLAAVWIQFQNHDWITHADNLTKEIIEIPLPDNDPARERYRQSNMFIGRTQPDPTRLESGEECPVTFINEVTHWWDGSQIYGSDQQTQDALRSGIDGKMKVTNKRLLPPDSNGVEMTGMVRNWWVGLAMLHNVFVHEHNAICDKLKEEYGWDDDNRLFNVARLINAAVMAKIHSVEWTPAILPNRGLDSGLNANWYGMLTNALRKPNERKTRADINVANPELGGVVGNAIDKHGSPYGLTEEFVEVYRLHSLLPETLQLRDHKTGEPIEEVPFPATRQAGSGKLTERVDMRDLFYSFGNQHPGQLVLNNFPRFMQELSVPGNPMFDMGAIDILRARERGVPRYNEFRRQLGLNPIRTFEDLTNDPTHVAKLKDIYGDGPDGVERLDLLVGTLGETTRPDMFGFGETMFQIFILNATRRLQADRFYTTDYTEDVYTAAGLQWVDDSDLKHVILRAYPDLEQTGLANITNAFEPWDTDSELSPDRHPLRGYDKRLKPDPWTGDSYRKR